MAVRDLDYPGSDPNAAPFLRVKRRRGSGRRQRPRAQIGFSLQSQRAGSKAAHVVLDEVPEIVDLFRLAIEAGFNIRLATDAVARHGSGVVASELALALDHVASGERLVDALEAVRDLGDPVRPLIDALLASERYGVPIAPALERLSDESRAMRRRRAEAAARKVPVKLLFPLVFCILPAFGLLTVVPLLARSLPSLSP